MAEHWVLFPVIASFVFSLFLMFENDYKYLWFDYHFNYSEINNTTFMDLHKTVMNEDYMMKMLIRIYTVIFLFHYATNKEEM